jgi:hypothetical protein
MPEAVQEATLDVLQSPGYRVHLALMHQEIAQLPSVDLAVGWLEEIASS